MLPDRPTDSQRMIIAAMFDPGPQPTLVEREGSRWLPVLLTVAGVVAALALLGQLAGP